MSPDGIKESEFVFPGKILPPLNRLPRGKSARDFASTAASNFSILIFSTVGGVLAARILGPAGRGEFAAAIVWAAILGVVVSLGFPQALTYFTARNPRMVGAIFYSSITMWLVQSTVGLVVGWVAASELLSRYQPAAVDAVRIYLFSIPFSLLTNYLSTMAQGLKRFGLFNTFRIASGAGYPLSLILACVTGIEKAPATLLILLVMQIVIAFAALAVFFLKVNPRGRFDKKLSRQIVGYGFKSYWGNLSWLANGRLDQFIMSAVIGLDQLGLYAVAVSYATITFPLSGSFAMVLFPNVAASDREHAIEKVKRVIKINLLSTGGSALFLALACPLILPLLFGADFSNSVKPALILIGGTVLLGSNYVLSDGLRGLGKPLVPSIGEAFGLVVTIVGLFIMIPRYGIIGAAWVSVISYGIVLIILIRAIKQTTVKGGQAP